MASESKESSSNPNILFVCSTNESISQIAEAIFNENSDEKAVSASLNPSIFGEIPFAVMRICQNHGIDISNQEVTDILDISIDEIDLILASNREIRDILKKRYPHLEIFTIKEYSGCKSDLDIQNPIGGTYDDYENCFNEIEEAVLRILNQNETVAKPTPRRNFKYLDDLIHSGVKEIALDSDIILEDGEESYYEEGIKLDVDGLVIDGNGYRIDANGKTRIFYCTGREIFIKNTILNNGFTNEYGGAIHNNGELTVSDSTLTENTAQESGGAIYNSEAELTISDSTLIGNSTGTGGAIYNLNAKVTISDSTFSENRAHYDGGAIRNVYGELTVSDSTFSENTTQENGGAICNWYSELTISDSNFSENSTQKESGGAIYNLDAEVTISNSNFSENTAQNDGGAIYNDYGELSISGSTFTENTTQEGSGGSIHNSEGNLKIYNCEFLNNKSSNNIILNNDSLQIHNTIFKDNQSKFIVLNEGDKSNSGIFYGEFRENNVEKSVLCNDGKFCIVEKTVFQNNISNNTMNIINKSELTLTGPKIKDQGKSILNQNYILLRKSPPELKDTICGEGTVESDDERISQGDNFDFGYLDKKIHESNTQEIILDHDITFENYEIDFYEGGIELDMDDLIINGNKHIIDGADKSRIFIITGKNITLKNIIFKNGHTHKNYDNSLNNNGGAIRINYDCNIIIENCEFTNNTSERGGAIHNTDGELTISDSTLTENTAQEGGGAIFNSNGELTVSDSTLTENNAQGNFSDGGAIYNSGRELTVSDSTLTKNTAQRNGGAIFNWKAKLTISDSTLTDNRAQGNFSDGGAIYNNGELTVSDSTLTKNTAQKNGGAIFNWEAKLTISDSTFAKNTAENGGGAIYNTDGKLTISDSTLTANTASGGAAILNRNSELTVSDSTLTKNTAQVFGGAIYHSSGELSISDSTLTENTAQFDGGAIYHSSGELSISDSTLTENTAQKHGGAIYNWSRLFLSNCTLEGNTSKDGGAAYLSKYSKKYKSNNCIFNDNKPDDVYKEKD